MSASRIRVLIISWLYPWPESLGGSMRTMSFVRFFKKLSDVDLIYSQDAGGKNEEKSFFSKIYHLEKKEYPESFSGRFRAFAKGLPYPIREYDPASLKQFRELIEANDYHYILARYCRSTNDLFNLPQKYKNRTIVDIDDILSGTLYDSFFHNNREVYRKIIRNLNKKLLINYEKRCLTLGAALFCCQIDRMKLVRTKKENVFVVPNIYDSKLFQEYDFGNGYLNENTLLFVGGLNYPPNIEGLRWFIERIFKKFKSVFQDGKLVVVGHCPTDEIRTLCENADGIELHADAADVRGYYERCRAVIAPLLAGGGTRIKILEAAAAKRPVLSTPMGAEGLDLKDGRDVLLFDTAEDFCSQYATLANEGNYKGLVHRARQVVEEKYSRNAFEASMEDVIEYVDGIVKAGST